MALQFNMDFSTTPVFYLVLFLTGFVTIIVRMYLRLVNINENKKFNDLWRGKKEMFDLVFLSLLIIPIFLVILINSSYILDGDTFIFYIH